MVECSRTAEWILQNYSPPIIDIFQWPNDSYVNEAEMGGSVEDRRGGKLISR